jgi:hypothetical protein
MKEYWLAIYIIVAFCFAANRVEAVQHRVNGTGYFTHHNKSMLKAPGLGANHYLPQRTYVELYAKDARTPLCSTTVGLNGSFGFSVEDPAEQEYYIVVFLRTMKTAVANSTPRIQFQDIGLVSNHNYKIKSNNFNFKNEDQATLSVGLKLLCGNVNDIDVAISSTTNSGELNQWFVDKPEDVNYNEEDIARLFAFMLGLDVVYGEIESSGKVPWFGQMKNWDKEGLRVRTPGGPIIGDNAGAFAAPETSAFTDALVMYVGDKGKDHNWRVGTAFHEFGHMVHYHSTNWTMGDLFAEVFSHWFYKETDRCVAVAEGWAEYFEVAAIESHLSIIDPTNSWTPLMVKSSIIYDKSWKGSECHDYGINNPTRYYDPRYSDGTNNSGEIVEGAVAQIFWAASKPKGKSLVADIEPVWRVLREGATGYTDKQDSRNSRKKMHTSDPSESVYDTWMLKAANAADRQEFRNICSKYGIVYNRMKIVKYRQVQTDEEPWRDIADDKDIWISRKAEFQLEAMSHGELETKDDGPPVAEARLSYLKIGANQP